MFRNAQITFRTTRFGGETRTDVFRVMDDPTDLDQHRLTKAVDEALHDAGERDFRIIRWSWAD